MPGAHDPESTHVEAEDVAPPVVPAIGRYQMLGLIGAGGMGMVFGAWDPELDRRVALKLVRSSSEVARERMLREGQILARLSHPNIVPVFDVGQTGDQIYLVMEYVRGTTLAAYAASAPGRDAITSAYREAGAGLAAAHKAGVIHRDFKPANAIRGEDGRVRVLDFGIALADGNEPDTVAGTPSYMAPEQRGGEITPAADQYAFCVSLRSALAANGGMPAWIAAVVERGTSEDPAARYPTFDDLLAALANDPARRRRRIAIAAGVVVAVAIAFAVGQSRARRAIESCTSGPATIATVWNAGARTRLSAHLTTFGPRGALESTRLAGELDRDAERFAAEYRGACLAHERKELSSPRYDARLDCLARTRAAMAAVVELVGTVDAKGLDAALFAARMRPDAAGCAEVVVDVVPPAAAIKPQIEALVPAIERALVLANAQRADAAAAGEAVVTAARATAYTPLVARALLVYGRGLLAAGDPEASRVLGEAMQLALAVSDDVLAVEAHARWVFSEARAGKPATANLEVMKLLAARLGPRGRFVRSLLFHNLGIARLVANDYEGARALLAQASDEAEHTTDIELAVIGQSLANLEPTIEASQAQIDATYRRYLDALGPSHPQTILIRSLAGLMTPDLARARELHTCDGLEGEARADCAYDAGWLADEAGDTAAASALFASYPDDDSLPGRIARAYVELRGPGGLSPATRGALDEIAARPVETSFEHVFVADALVVRALASTGADADRAWRRASHELSTVRLAMYRRRIARVDAALASSPATPRADAVVHAQRALAWYRAAGDAALVASLEAISRGSR